MKTKDYGKISVTNEEVEELNNFVSSNSEAEEVIKNNKLSVSEIYIPENEHLKEELYRQIDDKYTSLPLTEGLRQGYLQERLSVEQITNLKLGDVIQFTNDDIYQAQLSRRHKSQNPNRYFTYHNMVVLGVKDTGAIVGFVITSKPKNETWQNFIYPIQDLTVAGLANNTDHTFVNFSSMRVTKGKYTTTKYLVKSSNNTSKSGLTSAEIEEKRVEAPFDVLGTKSDLSNSDTRASQRPKYLEKIRQEKVEADLAKLDQEISELKTAIDSLESIINNFEDLRVEYLKSHHKVDEEFYKSSDVLELLKQYSDICKTNKIKYDNTKINTGVIMELYNKQWDTVKKKEALLNTNLEDTFNADYHEKAGQLSDRDLDNLITLLEKKFCVFDSNGQIKTDFALEVCHAPIEDGPVAAVVDEEKLFKHKAFLSKKGSIEDKADWAFDIDLIKRFIQFGRQRVSAVGKN